MILKSILIVLIVCIEVTFVKCTEIYYPDYILGIMAKVIALALSVIGIGIILCLPI